MLHHDPFARDGGATLGHAARDVALHVELRKMDLQTPNVWCSNGLVTVSRPMPALASVTLMVLSDELFMVPRFKANLTEIGAMRN